MDLWEKAPYRQVICLEDYLFTAVRYQVSSLLRDQHLTASNGRYLERLTTTETAQTILELGELRESYEESLNILPARCPEVFRMSRQEELSNKEIASRLKVSVRTVEAHLLVSLPKFERHTRAY